MLDAIRACGLENTCRCYQAFTSELYGKVKEVPQSETTPFYCSPYVVAKQSKFKTCKAMTYKQMACHINIALNCREVYGLHLTNDIIFNHESPQRGASFVARILEGLYK